MTTTAEAVYENGTVRLLEPLELAEGEHVRVVKTSIDALAKLGPHPDPQKAAQILAEIAAMSMESGIEGAQSHADIVAEISALSIRHGLEETSSRDHDKILYGPNGAR